MQTEQRIWTADSGWNSPAGAVAGKAQLVLMFGANDAIRTAGVPESIRAEYPHAHIAGCTTAGEIAGSHVQDDSVVLTAIQFDSTKVQISKADMVPGGSSFEVGQRVALGLPTAGLVHVFVLSDGLHINGTELVAGIARHLPAGVNVTGGLSGDGPRFKSTAVWIDGPPRERLVVAIGFYGSHLRIGYGSLGGWDAFGPERLITKSANNVLYELDGKSALDLYKRYLGEHAQDLPASALLFPLHVRSGPDDPGVVRTILSIDEKQRSMTFAGDMPTGSSARLMKANFDRLIEGASGAARINFDALKSREPELAILISCVGRKLVLKQRTEEEVDAVREVLGEKTCFTGFYSYGEISPLMPGVKCDLHNQTMTITTLTEES